MTKEDAELAHADAFVIPCRAKRCHVKSEILRGCN